MSRIRPLLLEPPRRYSLEEKRHIVTEIRRRHQQGSQPIQKLAGQMGISPWCYYRWARQIPPAPVMRPVEVMPVLSSPVPVSGVLISPQGYRVEGLAAAEIAQVLRMLA